MDWGHWYTADNPLTFCLAARLTGAQTQDYDAQDLDMPLSAEEYALMMAGHEGMDPRGRGSPDTPGDAQDLVELHGVDDELKAALVAHNQNNDSRIFDSQVYLDALEKHT
eukprot:COSAG06_NODE_17561_length_934_cov_0.924551_1_plen_109_part_10